MCFRTCVNGRVLPPGVSVCGVRLSLTAVFISTRKATPFGPPLKVSALAQPIAILVSLGWRQNRARDYLRTIVF